MIMIDGKVANACDNVNSSQRCNICSLTISQFNSPHTVSSVIVNECAYECEKCVEKECQRSIV